MNKVIDRFLVFLLTVLVIVTVALTIFYFMRSDEVFSFSTGSDDSLVRYVNTGETFDVTVYRQNASGDTYTLISTDENVVRLKEKVSDDVFRFETTSRGGRAEIKLQTSNVKYADLSLTVRVGDGTSIYPYFIRNYADLANIGNNAKFALDLNYLQVADIDMKIATSAWTPIAWGRSFTGVYNGNGHYIHNFSMTNVPASENVNNETENQLLGTQNGISSLGQTTVAALFYGIGKDGVVSRLNMNNVTIKGEYDIAAAVAGTNSGVIQFVDVTGLSISNVNSNDSALDGGIVGQNVGSSTGEAYDARVTYCSVEGVLSSGAVAVGGLAGYNGANGLIMNNYAKITISVSNSSAAIGGIVGKNIVSVVSSASNADCVRASVINNYAMAQISAPVGVSVGGIIGANMNSDGSTKIVLNPTSEAEKAFNRIYGNYYLAFGDLKGVGGLASVPSDEYIAMPLSAAQMRRVASASDLERISMDGADFEAALSYVTYAQNGEYTTWDFDRIWDIKSTENDGYPFIRTDAVVRPIYIFNGIYQGEPVDPIDPIEPEEPVEPIDPVDPVDPVDPIEPVDPVEPVEPVEPSTTMTQAELRALFDADLAANDNEQYTATYIISKDVIMTEAWVPVGTREQPFNGRFIMTNGAVIKNLYIVDCGVQYYGLFGYVGKNAIINGVSIEGIKIELSTEQTDSIYVGSLIGFSDAKCVNDVEFSLITVLNNKSQILGVTEGGFDSIVICNKQNVTVGGAIGCLGDEKSAFDLHVGLNIIIKDCDDANLTVGGVIGQNLGYADSCSYEGNLNGATTTAMTYTISVLENSGENLAISLGGIAGVNSYLLSACDFWGTLDANSSENIVCGGIAGRSVGRIEKCAAQYAVINGGYYVGGLVGVYHVNDLLFGNDNPAAYVGIKQSYAAGRLSGKRVGGLVGNGECGTIKNCYTTAHLSGETMAGFVVDLPYASEVNCGKVAYCYSSATFDTSAGKAYWESASVVRQTYWGGRKLAGYVENCIYNKHDSDEIESAKIDSIERQYSCYILSSGFDCDDGRTSDADCKKVSTFTGRGDGFDITVWSLVEGEYPQLLNVN